LIFDLSKVRKRDPSFSHFYLETVASALSVYLHRFPQVRPNYIRDNTVRPAG